MHPVERVVSRLETLAAALEAVAAATASANPDALAACEAPLAGALAQAVRHADLTDLDDADPEVVKAHLRRITAALARCRTLGNATTDLIRVSLSAQGIAPGYKPAGIGAPSPRLGRLEVRV